MEQYIGVKIIKASPMTLSAYNEYMGKSRPVEGETNANGYLVEYEQDPETTNKNHPDHEGCVSWSPENVFEKSYRLTSGLTFGLAVEAMKLGKKVARTGWNGVGIFAVLSPGKKELPASDFFNPHLSKHALSIGGVMDVRSAFMLKTAQEDVAYWSPSGSDCLAEDWFIVA